MHHSIVWCKLYFNILNCLGIDHQCDLQQTEWPLGTAQSNVIRRVPKAIHLHEVNLTDSFSLDGAALVSILQMKQATVNAPCQHVVCNLMK